MAASVLGWVARILLWVVILAACFVLLAAVLVPRVAGATPYSIMTSSMKPAMPPGTLVVVRPVDPHQIRAGDVVTYQLRSGQPTVVTHRVITQGVQHDGDLIFRTKGDANRVPDQDWVRSAQIRGRVWYAIPLLGYPAELLSGYQHQLVVYAIAAGLLGYAAYMFVSSARDRRRDREQRDQKRSAKRVAT
jgi:signal peptidase